MKNDVAQICIWRKLGKAEASTSKNITELRKSQSKKESRTKRRSIESKTKWTNEKKID